VEDLATYGKPELFQACLSEAPLDSRSIMEMTVMTADLVKAPQWGIVVPDIGTAMRKWSALLGTGPFMHIEEIAPHEHQGRYHGKPTEVRITVAFSYFGDTQIELIQQLNSAPSPYVDFLAGGNSGIQHIGVWSRDFEASYSLLTGQGYLPVYTAGMRGVAHQTTYFVDGEGAGGPMLELSMMTERKSQLFTAMAERVADWNGRHTVEQYKSMDALAEVLGTPSWTT
jgi:Glyoxalase/Bleomycin resistance protein/Dioxygenase superfamily